MICLTLPKIYIDRPVQYREKKDQKKKGGGDKRTRTWAFQDGDLPEWVDEKWEEEGDDVAPCPQVPELTPSHNVLFSEKKNKRRCRHY